jgi:hypothetical protein
MPRWVFLLAVVIGLLTAVFVTTDALLGMRPGVTERNVRRIKEGMSVSEVEALLGGPGVRSPWQPEGQFQAGGLQFSWHDYFWAGSEGNARVSFIRWSNSATKFVRAASFHRAPTKSPLTWLGL